MEPLTPPAADSLIEFPCDYPIKVMGRKTSEFRSAMLYVLTQHTGLQDIPVTERHSRDGTYISLTCTVPVTDRVQLDTIYKSLHATGLVLFAL